MHQLVAIVVLAVAIGSACGDDSDDPSAAVPGLTTTAAADPTTTSSSTTTTTTEPVPFEIEVKRAAVELLDIRNDVFQHPDVARVGEYIAETCVCLERERGYIERFVREGLHWTAAPIDVRGINLATPDPDDPEPHAWSLATGD